MAVGGAWVDLSCVDSANERDYRFYKRTPFVKKAEEGSNNRSVMSFRCSGLHACYNVRINRNIFMLCEPERVSYSYNP